MFFPNGFPHGSSTWNCTQVARLLPFTTAVFREVGRVVQLFVDRINALVGETVLKCSDKTPDTVGTMGPKKSFATSSENYWIHLQDFSKYFENLKTSVAFKNHFLELWKSSTGVGCWSGGGTPLAYTLRIWLLWNAKFMGRQPQALGFD